MTGINGTCTRDCELGRPHHIDCRNYIETELACPVCGTLYGRHVEGCILSPNA